MDKTIREIYCNLLQDESVRDVRNQDMKEEILDMLKEKEQLMEKENYEKYKDLVFRAASAAEETGFVKGFRYAFRLCAECINEQK